MFSCARKSRVACRSVGGYRLVRLHEPTRTADHLHREAASLFAAAALGRAACAMLVLASVPLAFIRTALRSGRAHFQRPQQHDIVEALYARDECACRDAEVGAIEVQADALTQSVDARPF